MSNTTKFETTNKQPPDNSYNTAIDKKANSYIRIGHHYPCDTIMMMMKLWTLVN